MNIPHNPIICPHFKSIAGMSRNFLEGTISSTGRNGQEEIQNFGQEGLVITLDIAIIK